MARKIGNKTAQPVDLHVGARIRFRRNLLGISQTEMADRIGVTFQQVQKYERGINRIGASRLIKICDVLQISPEWLFDGAPGIANAPARNEPARGIDAALAAFRADSLAPRLLLAWARLPAPTKRSMVALMAAVADGKTTIDGLPRDRRRRHVSMVAVTGT